MDSLKPLFQRNQDWSDSMRSTNPEFFSSLCQQQSPEYLWIGCSDSRVPANQIVDLLPGELFVHRNIANVVVHTDLNCLSVIQYAVDILKVKHIIVCGHYDCGGVKAALENKNHGLIDNWLQHIKDVRRQHASKFEHIKNQGDELDRLCELNVIEQATNVCNTTVVQQAWENGNILSVHGWIYSIANGKLKDLKVTRSSK